MTRVYTVKDIVRGKKVLKNGAVAGFVKINGQEKWRIVKKQIGGKVVKKSPVKKTSSKKRVSKTLKTYYRKKQTAGRKSPKRRSIKSPKKSPRKSPKKRINRKNKKGGSRARPVSLKTAVSLLRQYYTEKYN